MRDSRVGSRVYGPKADPRYHVVPARDDRVHAANRDAEDAGHGDKALVDLDRAARAGHDDRDPGAGHGVPVQQGSRRDWSDADASTRTTADVVAVHRGIGGPEAQRNGGEPRAHFVRPEDSAAAAFDQDTGAPVAERLAVLDPGS